MVGKERNLRNKRLCKVKKAVKKFKLQEKQLKEEIRVQHIMEFAHVAEKIADIRNSSEAEIKL
jgi:hypothetical protein